MKRHHSIATIPEGYDSPFAYSSLTHLVSFWWCDAEQVVASLGVSRTHAEPLVEDGRALIAVSYQSYLADYGSESTISHELELGPVVVPTGTEPPAIEAYITGADQRGVTGIWPTAVYCDCAPAISAGRAIYGEPKYFADFAVEVPAPNHTTDAWQVRSTAEDGRVLELSILLDGITLPSPAAPIVNFGFREESEEVVASRLDIHTLATTYYPQHVHRAAIDEKTGDGLPSRHPELKGAELALARTHVSRPVAQRNRPYFPTSLTGDRAS